MCLGSVVCACACVWLVSEAAWCWCVCLRVCVSASYRRPRLVTNPSCDRSDPRAHSVLPRCSRLVVCIVLSLSPRAALARTAEPPVCVDVPPSVCVRADRSQTWMCVYICTACARLSAICVWRTRSLAAVVQASLRLREVSWRLSVSDVTLFVGSSRPGVSDVMCDLPVTSR